jgi:lysophospholipase L1-like esterase
MTTESHQPVSRRAFLQVSTAGGGTLAAATMIRPAAVQAQQPSRPKQGAVLLFQGDSITDAGRSRRSTGPNDAAALGHGYPMLLGAALLADHPAASLKVMNRGISGNKVPDLAKRWQADAIALKPDLLSILVGVNDIWHKLNGSYAGTVEDYEAGYRELLKQTHSDLPETRIVICEPFVLRCGAVNDSWFPEFEHRRRVAKKLADELDLTFVPFQAVFNKGVESAPPEYWAGDGVHPTLAGHGLMAKTWRECVGI